MTARTILTMSNGITDPLCYLATPYSKLELVKAFEDAARIAAALLSSGMKVYSPIAHTHPLAIYGHLDPLDHSIWLPFDEAMMRVCDALIVAHMSGWDESVGIAHEIAFFAHADKPIFDLNPDTMVMTKRRAKAA